MEVEATSVAAVTWVAAIDPFMQHRLVMTIIGPDRPGLVDSVAGLVAKHKGNWLESRMSRLGGFFAGILRVEVPHENEQRLRASLESLKTAGLTVVVHPDKPFEEASSAQIVRLEVMGQDRPGIVRQIAHELAGYGVNVEELDTECASAAMSGENMFKACAKLSVPAGCNTIELRRRLECIAGDLIVDLSFEEVASAATPYSL